MQLRTSFKTGALIACWLLLVIGVLAACSSSTSSTTATSTSAKGTSTPGLPKPVTGTVSHYNASTKVLTLKLSNGSTQDFNITKDKFIQDQKITSQQLSTLLGKNGIDVFMIGHKGSDGTYTAQEIVASTTMGGSHRNVSGKRVYIQNSKLQKNQLIADDTSGHPVTVNLNETTTLLGQTPATESDLQVGQTDSVVTLSAQSMEVVIGPRPIA